MIGERVPCARPDCDRYFTRTKRNKNRKYCDRHADPHRRRTPRPDPGDGSYLVVYDPHPLALDGLRFQRAEIERLDNLGLMRSGTLLERQGDRYLFRERQIVLVRRYGGESDGRESEA